MQITLTPFVLSDQEKVKEFLLASLKVFGFRYNSEYDADLDDPQKYYIDNDGIFFVLKTGNEVIGTVAIINKRKHIGELERLYVDKNYQDMDFGSKLLAKAFAFCREKGFKILKLETNKKFIKAHILYRKRGFITTKEDDRSYFMEKIL